MRIVIVAVGRQRAPFLDDAEHYLKLLSRYVRVEVIEVADDDGLARRRPERAHTALLAIDGDQLDSHGWAGYLEQRRGSGQDLCLLIGGAFGAPPLEGIDRRLSLGRITLPHQLARVVLLEQLYRAHKIIAGEPYHH